MNTKFDPKRCTSCKYRGTIGSRKDSAGCVTCDRYIHKGTCLKKAPSGETYDIRGYDYNDCKCYEKGAQLTHREAPVVGVKE